MTSNRRVVLPLLAVVLSACATQTLTVSEYAETIDSATALYISESQTLSANFQFAVQDEVNRIVASDVEQPLRLATEATVKEMTLYLAFLEDSIERYTESMQSMNPPKSLDEAHSAYVEATVSVRVSMPATREAVGAAVSLDAVQRAIGSSGFVDGQLRWTATCRTLEAAIRSEGSGVDLGCALGNVAP